MTRPNYYNENDYSPRLSTEIYALRRNGQLDEARQLAEKILRQDETNVDILKAYAWTLIDICKREQQGGNLVEAQKFQIFCRACISIPNLMSLQKRLLEKYKH